MFAYKGTCSDMLICQIINKSTKLLKIRAMLYILLSHISECQTKYSKQTNQFVIYVNTNDDNSFLMSALLHNWFISLELAMRIS
jgi:hypothetical protein